METIALRFRQNLPIKPSIEAKYGIVLVINLKMPDPEFEGQTKEKLGNQYVKDIVEKVRQISWNDGFQFFSYGSWKNRDYFETAAQDFFINH